MAETAKELVAALEAKAWQSTRWKKGQKPKDHLCWRAANRMAAMHDLLTDCAALLSGDVSGKAQVEGVLSEIRTALNGGDNGTG